MTIDDVATPGTFYKVTSSYGGVPTFFISKEDLLANKRAAAKPHGLGGVAFLESLD